MLYYKFILYVKRGVPNKAVKKKKKKEEEERLTCFLRKKEERKVPELEALKEFLS